MIARKYFISTLHTVVCLVACTPLSALLQLSACRIAGLLSSLLFSIKMEDSDVRSLRASLRAMKKEELERRYEEEQEKHERRERKLLDALSSAGISEWEIGQMLTET